MRVSVTKEFVDVHTKSLHEKGSIFECSNERFTEIKKAGDYVEKLPEIKPEPKKEKAEK